MTPKREAELFDREELEIVLNNEVTKELRDFIQSECRRNRVEAVKEIVFNEIFKPNQYGETEWAKGYTRATGDIFRAITQALAELEGKGKTDAR